MNTILCELRNFKDLLFLSSLIIISIILSGVLGIIAFYLTFFVALLILCRPTMYCIVYMHMSHMQPFGCNTIIKFFFNYRFGAAVNSKRCPDFDVKRNLKCTQHQHRICLSYNMLDLCAKELHKIALGAGVQKGFKRSPRTLLLLGEFTQYDISPDIT